ncbi:YgiT-type zinc finger protein, partial [Synechocystis salina LEGE 06155]|nr:YgiT-type zinc finger protein [Synechocystis salina LEGE 06155]
PAWVCDQCGEVLFEAREELAGLDRETTMLVSQSSR